MKKYFLHNGTESSGPFSFDQLISLKITKKTPVWFEGMENWKYAGDIEELKSIFEPTPPPLQSFKEPIPAIKPITPIVESNNDNNDNNNNNNNNDNNAIPKNTLGLLSKSNWITGIVLAVILLVTTLVFNYYQTNRNRELEEKNRKTEIENRQYEIQKQEIENQKATIAEQEEKEAERDSKETKLTINNRLVVIQNLLSLTNENLENAKFKLADVSGFKFFRTADQKEAQIKDVKNEIKSYLNQITNLNNESNQLNLKLEKIK